MADKWKCSEQGNEDKYYHFTRCENCFGECGGKMCVDCCSRIYEGYDSEEEEEEE